DDSACWKCKEAAQYATYATWKALLLERVQPMDIGLISDTHIPEAMPELPVQIRQVFADTELILHAGDLHCFAVLDWLEEIAPVLAARGNGDSGSGGRPVVPEDPGCRKPRSCGIMAGPSGWCMKSSIP